MPKVKIRKRRKTFIVIFQDLDNQTRYAGLLPAYSIKNAEFMADCLNGMIIGEMDLDGTELYYKEQIEKLNYYTYHDTWLT